MRETKHRKSDRRRRGERGERERRRREGGEGLEGVKAQVERGQREVQGKGVEERVPGRWSPARSGSILPPLLWRYVRQQPLFTPFFANDSYPTRFRNVIFFSILPPVFRFLLTLVSYIPRVIRISRFSLSLFLFPPPLLYVLSVLSRVPFPNGFPLFPLTCFLHKIT